MFCKEGIMLSLGGLNLSWSCLDWESQSRIWQKVSLDSLENLDSFKKLVSTIEKSGSRSRNLNFVTTPPSSPKSLDRDQEICRDLKILINLDSLSQSRSRVSWFYHLSQSRFLKLSRFLNLKSLKKSRLCHDILINLKKSGHSFILIQKSRF
jgi:hypothetical protein